MRVRPPETDRERAEALACLLRTDADMGGSDRLRESLALAEAGEIDLNGLVAAWKDGQAICAALSCRTPDGSVFVWPPEVRSGGRHQDAVDVLGEVVARADASGCPFAQAAVESDRQDHQAALEAVGFRFLTDLLYMRRSLCDPLPVPCPVGGQVVTFTDREAARFATVIERTFIDSRDCPGFSGVRSASDALRSYRHAGEFTPARWRLVERDAHDVAVILVNDRTEERAQEIVYLGVAPEARRQRLGHDLVAIALHEARAGRFDSVLAAVDASNVPAIALYKQLGFSPVSRRRIYLRRVGDDNRPVTSGGSRADSH